MVITEKDISQDVNKTSQGEAKKQKSSVGKKVGKILLFVVAVFLGLGILGGILPDDEEDEAVESEEIAVEKTITPLMVSELKYGTSKEKVIKLFKSKGWTLIGEKDTSKNNMASAIEFITPKEGLFQNHIAHNIILSFDEDDELQSFEVFIDISPDVMKQQGFTNLYELIQSLSDDCFVHQGYKRVEIPQREYEWWGFKKGKNIGYIHFEDRFVGQGVVVIDYMSKIAQDRLDRR